MNAIEEQLIVLNPKLKPTTEVSDLGHRNTTKSTIADLAEQSKLDPKSEIQSIRDVTGEYPHTNFLSYLELCWGKHFTPVITPDAIWYTLLCEIALLVKAAPERVRHLFSNTEGKQEIIVPTGHAERLPMDLIIDQLKRLVPSDASKYLPSFTTSTPNSQLAFNAAFADAVSPYYNYGMYLCGFPGVVVRGNHEDWMTLPALWEDLPKELFPDSKYRTRVQAGLVAMGDTSLRNKPEFWADMFSLKKCGSGHQTEVQGWIRELFVKRPEVGYVGNYSSHASRVDYRNFTTQKDFSLFAGLFSSDLTAEGVLEPYFGSFVIEKKPVEKKVEGNDAADALAGLMPVFGKMDVEPIVPGNKKLKVEWTFEDEQDIDMMHGL
jgi:hypothetical protein